MKDDSKFKLDFNNLNHDNLEENNIELKNSKDVNNDDDKINKNKRIIKPLDLEKFDTPYHFHKNIILYDLNCKHNITSQSYYCMSCKLSVCILCGIYNHKDHILIQRDNCLFYDSNFFVEISKIIDISLQIVLKKQYIKDTIKNNILFLKNYLDELKTDKYKEIDEYFDKININMNKLKKSFDEMKIKIENYYNRYNKFFNIKYVNEKINISDSNINNLDIENSVFLMNFDLMNLCDNKNLKVSYKSNEITNKVNSLEKLISDKIKSIKNIINTNFDLGLDISPFENYYYEVVDRVQKYSEFINQFQETIADIFHKNGNFDKIKELLGLFDSKNKKNKDIIFQQKFFKEQKNNNENLSNKNPESSTTKKEPIINNYTSNSNEKRNISYKSNLKVNLCLKNNFNNDKTKKSKSLKKLKVIRNKNEQNINSSSKRNTSNKLYKYNKNLSENIIYNKENLSSRTIISSRFTSDDVTLNNRIIQRFFSYSIYEWYSNNFRKDLDDEMNSIKKGNSSYRKSETKNNNISHHSNSKIKERNSSVKKTNTNSYNLSKRKLFINKDINDSINKTDRNQYNLKSITYLANYQNRYNSLKEMAKPTSGTNQIQTLEPSTKKTVKKTVILNKDQHGYSIFPDGCRHILINNILYITGGNNKCGSIVLSYDILSNKLIHLSNFISEHYFHTLEYIDNFDCIICIGGENSSCCEIMDINTKKWKKLPNLNYPRANCNVYYNNITEQIYVLFGMKGNILERNNKNIDKIELLELNNIDKGWSKIEYYKSCGIDLKFNFCRTIPFSKDKLLIFGGNYARNTENQNFYVIFDMNKYEIIQVDKQTMDMIKMEEKKIMLNDLALTKFN